MPIEQNKPVMIIGPARAGKTTLLKALSLFEGEVKKTESILYTSQAIDTPGEMMQIPYLYNALILNSSRAALVLFLVNARRPVRIPARMALALKAPAAGVVSQIDGAEPGNIDRAEAALALAGVDKIFRVSSVTGEGIEDLRAFILERFRGQQCVTYT